MIHARIFLTLSLVSVFTLLCSSAIWAQAGSEDQAWHEDLDVFEQQLNDKHINLFHTIDAADFQGEMAGLRQNGAALSKHERRVALMRLARKIGDGHTSAPLWTDTIRRFPIEVTLIGEAVVVTGVSAEHELLLGAKLTHIRERESQNLIIDLRDNFGGDFYTGLELASYLNLADSVNWQQGVYVLTGHRTFSAAMSNTAQFRQVLNATLVGSPTGGQPCGYQDMGQFTLPNASMIVTYSKRRFCFIDTDADTIYPDHAVDTPLEDYTGDKDSVLEWVLSVIKNNQSKVRE